MPVTGAPDLDKHFNCEKCDRWFEDYEGQFFARQRPGLSGMVKDAIEGGRVRFRCHSCADRSQRNRLIFWGSLAALVGIASAIKYWLDR